MAINKQSAYRCVALIGDKSKEAIKCDMLLTRDYTNYIRLPVATLWDSMLCDEKTGKQVGLVTNMCYDRRVNTLTCLETANTLEFPRYDDTFAFKDKFQTDYYSYPKREPEHLFKDSVLNNKLLCIAKLAVEHPDNGIFIAGYLVWSPQICAITLKMTYEVSALVRIGKVVNMNLDGHEIPKFKNPVFNHTLNTPIWDTTIKIRTKVKVLLPDITLFDTKNKSATAIFNQYKAIIHMSGNPYLDLQHRLGDILTPRYATRAAVKILGLDLNDNHIDYMLQILIRTELPFFIYDKRTHYHKAIDSKNKAFVEARKLAKEIRLGEASEREYLLGYANLKLPEDNPFI